MASTDPIVVDASALLALILPDLPTAAAYSDSLIEEAEKGRRRLLIPQVCHLELATVIAKRLRSRAVTESQATDFFDLVEGIGLEVVVESYTCRELVQQALAIGCQVGDSIYVALARESRASVATLDRGMRQAAVQLKIPIFGV